MPSVNVYWAMDERGNSDSAWVSSVAEPLATRADWSHSRCVCAAKLTRTSNTWETFTTFEWASPPATSEARNHRWKPPLKRNQLSTAGLTKITRFSLHPYCSHFIAGHFLLIFVQEGAVSPSNGRCPGAIYPTTDMSVRNARKKGKNSLGRRRSAVFL